MPFSLKNCHFAFGMWTEGMPFVHYRHTVKHERKKSCAVNFEDFKDPELQEKLKNARSPQELLELARESDFELSDEQLEGVSGGDSWACWDIKGCTDVCARYNA